MIKCSFDYDYTLDRNDVQIIASKLVDDGFDVYVVTSRYDTESSLKKGWTWIEEQNEKLFKVADDCGIKKENIIFMSRVDKIEYLSGKDFLFHLDDDADELVKIMQSKDSCKPLNVEYTGWEDNIKELIEKYER